MKAALVVEALMRAGDENFGLVKEMHVEKNPYATQIVLRAHRAGGSHAGSQNGGRFARKGLIGRTGGPVDSVLQDAGNGEIVFGGGEEDRVRRSDLLAKAL